MLIIKAKINQLKTSHCNKLKEIAVENINPTRIY